MTLVSYMNSSTGRLVRIIVGLLIILIGLAVIGGSLGVVVAIVGLLPLSAGTFNFCLIAPFFGKKSMRSSRG